MIHMRQIPKKTRFCTNPKILYINARFDHNRVHNQSKLSIRNNNVNRKENELPILNQLTLFSGGSGVLRKKEMIEKQWDNRLLANLFNDLDQQCEN